MLPLFRIHAADGRQIDWKPPNLQLKFLQVLEVLSTVLVQENLSAFDYEDGEGDRITVRSDEELSAMLSYLEKHQPVVDVYPRCTPGKSPHSRNVHGLTVACNSYPAQQPAAAGLEVASLRKQTDISEALLQPASTLEQRSLRLEDVELLQELGGGRSGTVYRARDRRSDTSVAVKVVALDVTAEEQSQITSELAILHRCHSPAIIKFYGAFFHNNCIYLCTEFMDGGSLDGCAPLPENVIARITKTVATGLHYLWTMRIMHRDVKPSNILINSAGRVKLCDFGVSIQLVNSIAKTYVGTNAYMAPERIQGGQYSIHSDVWSLGVTLQEIALGRFPYTDSNSASILSKPMELLHRIVNELPPTLSLHHFSPHFVSFVSKCLEKVPQARPTPQALLEHVFVKNVGETEDSCVREWVLTNIATKQARQRH